MISFIFLPFVFYLFPTLGPVGRMIPLFVSRLFFICFPLRSHSELYWSHDSLHLFSIGFSFVSTCVPLWVRLVA